MWITSPWGIYMGMTRDKAKKVFEQLKALLRNGEDHDEIMRKCDEFGQQIMRDTQKAQKFIQYEGPRFSGNKMLDLLFPLQMLEAQEEEPGVLRGTMTINGVHFHAEAIEVVYMNDGCQTGATPSADEFLEDLPYRDGAWETVPYKGKEYVLHIFPHAR